MYSQAATAKMLARCATILHIQHTCKHRIGEVAYCLQELLVCSAAMHICCILAPIAAWFASSLSQVCVLRTGLLSPSIGCCAQLAGQSVESFMERRGFHALPDHEEVWAVPVSEAPAAYNLRGHIIDAAEDHEEELNEVPSDLTAGDAAGPPKDKPARSRQKVREFVACEEF